MDNIEEKVFSLGRLDIVDLYEWHTSGKIIFETYFQRQNVWRLKDRIDLIDTILKGYPIPSIFINNAITNLDTISKKYNVLDGRQRLESIFGYLENKFEYKGKKFSELSKDEKTRILNYNISLVQMYIDPSDTSSIKEVFKRLNKSAYTLNVIEKQSSQMVEYDFMVISKIVVGIIKFQNIESYIEEIKTLFPDENTSDVVTSDDGELSIVENVNSTIEDIDVRIKKIADFENIDSIQHLYINNLVFTPYQVQRQVNLQHFMNIYYSILIGEIQNRNVSDKNIMEASDKNDNELKDALIRYNNVCKFLIELYSKEELNPFWRNLSSLYSLSFLFSKYSNLIKKNSKEIVDILNNFYTSNSELETRYKILSKEAVNDKTSRVERNDILVEVFNI